LVANNLDELRKMYRSRNSPKLYYFQFIYLFIYYMNIQNVSSSRRYNWLQRYVPSTARTGVMSNAIRQCTRRKCSPPNTAGRSSRNPWLSRIRETTQTYLDLGRPVLARTSGDEIPSSL